MAFSDTVFERHLRLTGFWPMKSLGTKAPTTMTRATTAYLDKLESGVRKLYQVGDNWLRLVEREDSNSESIIGYLCESAGTNLVDYSEDFSSGWSKTQANDSISTDQETAPNKEVSMDAIVASTDDSTHLVEQVVALTSAETYVFSSFVKKGDKDWAYLNNSDVANCYAYFNVSTGVVGSKGAGVADHGIEDWGGGIFRIWMKFDAA